MNDARSRVSATLRALGPALIRLTAAAGLLLASACATTRPGPASHEEVPGFVSSIKPGDFVECEMKRGPTREFTVVEVKSGWLIGRETSAYARDIVKVRITSEASKRWNDVGTEMLVLGAVAELAGRGR